MKPTKGRGLSLRLLKARRWNGTQSETRPERHTHLCTTPYRRIYYEHQRSRTVRHARRPAITPRRRCGQHTDGTPAPIWVVGCRSHPRHRIHRQTNWHARKATQRCDLSGNRLRSGADCASSADHAQHRPLVEMYKRYSGSSESFGSKSHALVALAVSHFWYLRIYLST